MTIAGKKSDSLFAQSALALDEEFTQFERLSGEIERLSIDSDSGLERGRHLLLRFGECGQRIGEGIQALAKNLEEARTRAEVAAGLVSARANQIQERQQKVDQMLERFQALGEMVRNITNSVSQLQKSAKGELSLEEKNLLIKHLPQINSQLNVLITEALKLKKDAQLANMKSLEKNADSLGQSLQSVCQRLNSLDNSSSDVDFRGNLTLQ